MINIFFITLIFSFALPHCTSVKKVRAARPSKEVIRVDSRGCMVAHQTALPPALPAGKLSISIVESYYEKLEFYFLLTAEKCLSSKDNCPDFESMMETLEARFLPAKNSDSDVALSTKHSNNKLLAIAAIHKYFYEKKYKASLSPTPWLSTLLKENDHTAEAGTIDVQLDQKKYSAQAHNIAVASARAHVFVGIAEKNPISIKTGLEQIPKVIETLRPDGSLPIEARRGSRALRYSMQVLSDIVAMIYIADKEQRLPTYAKHREAILKMAQYDLSVLQKSSIIAPYAQENFSPGPITNPEYQDISSLRSRLAWVFLLDKLETGFLEKNEDKYLDKESCAHELLKNSFECSTLVQTIGDILETPLGFTTGINPKCAAIVTH